MARVNGPQTMFDKVWASHVVTPESVDAPAVLYVDMHFTHEVSSPVAFAQLRSLGLAVRRPDRTLATLDQGWGARTLLASPLTAAASAVSGVISDPRLFIRST